MITQFSSVIKALEGGQVVALPTDTFYALCATAKNEKAVNEVYRLKERDTSSPTPLFASNLEQIRPFVKDIPIQAQKIAKNFWPGAVTILLSANNKLPSRLTKDGKVGFRIPNHPFLLKVLEEIKTPITATSANIAGMPPAKTKAQTLRYFPKIGIIDQACGKSLKPSTVIDATICPPKVLREGEISFRDIKGVI